MMQNRNIIKWAVAGCVVVALGWVGFSALNESSVEYTSIERAAQLGRTVQIAGAWVKEKGSRYDAPANIFYFTMRDESGKEIPVELTGAKPNNFEVAISVVAKGRMENGVFKASYVLTKCPSKYEGQPEDEGQAS